MTTKKKSLESMRKFWEFGWDCWINIFEQKSFPKSISYNNEQSLKIYILLDTKRKFIICENSQLNTTWLIYILSKSRLTIQDCFTTKKSFKISWNLNSINPLKSNSYNAAIITYRNTSILCVAKNLIAS
jgi:hypothetical protein